MKINKLFSLMLVISLVMAFSTELQSQTRQVNWTAFSINLVKAIKSNHPGLQQSAMKHIIQYSDQLNVKSAVYEIGQIFRFDENPQMRRLAMVALSEINTDESLAILCKYSKFEENSRIRNQCCKIVNEYYVAKNPEKAKELAVNE